MKADIVKAIIARIQRIADRLDDTRIGIDELPNAQSKEMQSILGDVERALSDLADLDRDLYRSYVDAVRDEIDSEVA